MHQFTYCTVADAIASSPKHEKCIEAKRQLTNNCSDAPGGARRASIRRTAQFGGTRMDYGNSFCHTRSGNSLNPRITVIRRPITAKRIIELNSTITILGTSHFLTLNAARIIIKFKNAVAVKIYANKSNRELYFNSRAPQGERREIPKKLFKCAMTSLSSSYNVQTTSKHNSFYCCNL